MTQLFGTAPEKIVIEVVGGVIVAVYAINPLTEIEIKDWDTLELEETTETLKAMQEGFTNRMTNDYHKVL